MKRRDLLSAFRHFSLLHDGPRQETLSLTSNPSRKASPPLTLAPSGEALASSRFIITNDRIRQRARDELGNKTEQIVRGLACLRSRSHDRTIVFAQDLEPVADVIGMANRRHDPERCATECGAELSHQFLEGVFLGAMRSALVAVEARAMPGRVAELMQRGAMPVDRLEIGLRGRDLHIVFGRRIECAIAANMKRDAGRLDSAAGHKVQRPVTHTRLRAALRLFLPMIPYDPSYSSTVFCIPDCIKSIQRTSSSRRTACDVRPQKTSHETRFVLARHLAKIL